jgi:hypothetical protein
LLIDYKLGNKQEDFEIVLGNNEGKMVTSSTSESSSNKNAELNMNQELEELTNKPIVNSTKLEPPESKKQPPAPSSLKTTNAPTVKKPNSASSGKSTPLVSKSLNTVKSTTENTKSKVIIGKTSNSTVFKKPTLVSNKTGNSGRSTPQIKYTATPIARASLIYKQSDKQPTSSQEKKPPAAVTQLGQAKTSTQALFKAASQKITTQVPKINMLFKQNSSSKLASKSADTRSEPPVDLAQLQIKIDSENARLDRELLNEIASLKRDLEVIRKGADSAQEAFSGIKTEFEGLKLNNFHMSAQITILEFGLEEEKKARLELTEKMARL